MKKYDFSDFDNSKYDFSDFENKPDVSELESLLRGAGQGISYGFADEITGGLESLLTDKSYEQARDESRKAYQQAQDSNPVSYGAGEIGGAIGSAFIPGVGVLNAGKAATFAGRAGLAAVQGGLTGAGLSQEEDFSGLAKDAAIGAATGAAMQGVGEKILAPAMSKAGQFVKNKILDKADDFSNAVLKKGGRIGANIPEEYTDEYLKRAGNIDARPRTEIMDELSGFYSRSQDELDNAHGLVKTLKADLFDTKQAFRDQLSDAKFEAREALNESRNAFNEASRGVKENLKNSNVMSLKDSILNSIDDLKGQVSKGSGEAYKVLDNVGGTLNVADLKGRLAAEMDDLVINGTPISDSAASSLKTLQNLQSRLTDLGENITFPQAKKIIQQLDADISISGSKGTFSPEADKIKYLIRDQLDQALKQSVPEYAEIMGEVSNRAQLLQQMSVGFGNEVKVINRLNNLTTEKAAQVDIPLLQKLGEYTDNDFITPIQKHVSNIETLSTPSRLTAVTEALPEYQNLKTSSEYVKGLSDPKTSRAIPELQAVLSAERKLEEAQKNLAKAKFDAELFKGLSPNTVENKVKSLTGGRTYGADNTFSRIDEVTGSNFSKEIKDRAILDSFEKASTNGSRNTLFGTIVGGAAGSIVGPLGTTVGSVVGAGIGHAGDKYAGRVFKALLDGKISADKALPQIADKLGKYYQPLMKAAQNSPKSLAATHFVLMQRDPNYRQLMNEEE